MTDYDIDVLGVVRGIERTVAVTETLATDAAVYQDGLNHASITTGGGIVAVALGDFANHYAKHLPQMFARTGQVIQATVNATTAYIEGDQQMADNASSASASTGDGSGSQGDSDGSGGTHEPVGVCGGTEPPDDGGIKRGGGPASDDGSGICFFPPAVG
ncbi:MAG: hypothetical protein GEV10_21890 [Streptosporangiales bacterium]|nr:hypothetical protein [Streptosporangiales bacterium]